MEARARGPMRAVLCHLEGGDVGDAGFSNRSTICAARRHESVASRRAGAGLRPALSGQPAERSRVRLRAIPPRRDADAGSSIDEGSERFACGARISVIGVATAQIITFAQAQVHEWGIPSNLAPSTAGHEVLSRMLTRRAKV